MVSKADGEVKESTLTAGDISNKIPKILNPTGGKLMVSKADGEVKESTLTPDYARLNSQLRVKNSLEKVKFINNIGCLLLMDMRVTYATSCTTFIFD